MCFDPLLFTFCLSIADFALWFSWGLDKNYTHTHIHIQRGVFYTHKILILITYITLFFYSTFYVFAVTIYIFFFVFISIFGEENGNPLQYSCLENPRDWVAWLAAIYGVAQSQTRLKRRSSSSISILFMLKLLLILLSFNLYSRIKLASQFVLTYNAVQPVLYVFTN